VRQLKPDLEESIHRQAVLCFLWSKLPIAFFGPVYECSSMFCFLFEAVLWIRNYFFGGSGFGSGFSFNFGSISGSGFSLNFGSGFGSTTLVVISAMGRYTLQTSNVILSRVCVNYLSSKTTFKGEEYTVFLFPKEKCYKISVQHKFVENSTYR
jgi:hypothetical protein